jgi:phosphopantothenoylcysteine decarboxylase
MKILIGLTGSVATTLIDKIVKSFSDHEVKFIATESSMNFIHSDVPVLRDNDEWKDTSKVLHIELVKWCDVFVIMPCSANTLAKLSWGISDNLLMSCARAWDFNKKMWIAPSMNTKMWEHPSTLEQLQRVKSWGIGVIDPVEKVLYCGDKGIGAMESVDKIKSIILG